MRESEDKVKEEPSFFVCPSHHQMVKTSLAYDQKLTFDCMYCKTKYFGNTERIYCKTCKVNCCSNCIENLGNANPPRCNQVILFWFSIVKTNITWLLNTKWSHWGSVMVVWGLFARIISHANRVVGMIYVLNVQINLQASSVPLLMITSKVWLAVTSSLKKVKSNKIITITWTKKSKKKRRREKKKMKMMRTLKSTIISDIDQLSFNLIS